MLWMTLLDKLLKQPIRITAHNFATVIVDGKEREISGIKFKEDGTFSLTV